MAFCLLYSPALTTICEHWEDHSIDSADLCWQSNVTFQHTVYVCHAFLPRSNRLLVSWLQSPSVVILKPKKRKSVTTSTFPPSICHAVTGPDAMILVFLIFSLKPAHSLSSFILIKRLFSSSSVQFSSVQSLNCVRLFATP